MAETDTPQPDDSQRDSLFDVLKQTLKARGITYATLGNELQLSELTIKRLFAERDCKLSRLMQLCQAAGISLGELVDMQQRRRQVATYLPLDIEQALAARPVLFSFLALLVSRYDTSSGYRQSGLSEVTFYRYLRELEQLGILKIGTNNQFTYTVPLPIRWRLDGPLAGVIIRANTQYLQHALEHATQGDYAVALTSRLMTAQSAQSIKEGLQQLQQQFDYLATQDQLFYKAAELELHKLAAVMGPFPVAALFPLAPE